MKVLLLKDITNLGKRLEVKEVNEGYARNFLFTKGLAVVADSPKARLALEDAKKSTRRSEKSTSIQKAFADKLENKVIELKRQTTESGTLYASINSQEIVEEVSKKLHIDLNPARIKINEPIKRMGAHKVRYGKGSLQTEFKVIVSALSSKSQNSNNK